MEDILIFGRRLKKGVLHLRTTTLDVVGFLLSPLTVFGDKNLMITITQTPFEIHMTYWHFAECTWGLQVCWFSSYLSVMGISHLFWWLLFSLPVRNYRELLFYPASASASHFKVLWQSFFKPSNLNNHWPESFDISKIFILYHNLLFRTPHHRVRPWFGLCGQKLGLTHFKV